MQTQNERAKHFRSLHKPGQPIILTNVWDAATAAAVIAHPKTKAVATASFAIAATNGKDDANLSWEENLERIKLVVSVVVPAGLPLTVDVQDGYEDVAATIRTIIKAGAVGCNIEDLDNRTDKLRDLDDAVSRIKTACKAASDAGVPDFCINARTDVLYNEEHGTVENAIERGKAYLAAGATTVYVWGGPKGRGVSGDEVQQLVRALGGMLNVKQNLRPGFLRTNEISSLGVARISIGPELYRKMMVTFQSELDVILAA